MAVNYNIDAINVVLLEIFEEIIVGIMNGSYEDESDESLVPVVEFILSAIASDTNLSGDTLSPDSVDPSPILEEAPLINTVQEDDDTSVEARVLESICLDS